MTFEKKKQLNPHHLTLNTQYRFIELEIYRAFKVLSRITLNESTSAQLVTNLLVPDTFYTEKRREAFKNMLLYNFDFIPKHEELVHYFRYKNLGMSKIRKYISVQFKDLTTNGIYDIVPQFDPIWQHWKETQSAFITWNLTKNNLNLFDDTLIQTELTPLEIAQPIEHSTQTQIQEIIPVSSLPAFEPTPTSDLNRIVKYFNITKEQHDKGEWALEVLEEDEFHPGFQDGIKSGTPIIIVKWEE